jgi:hypothetical protein
VIGRWETKQLALDTRVAEVVEGLMLRLGNVEKDPRNPLMQADKPWENSLNNLYPNVLYDEREQRFKLWYKCVLVDPEVQAKMMPPRTVHDVGWFLLYATSRDGLSWEKPELGLHGFDGSTRNNAVTRDTPNVGVFRDPHAPDPQRRYKMIYDVGSGQMRVRFSPDGIHWTQPFVPDGLGMTGDTHNNAWWDERLGRYVLITRFYLGERTVARSESDDFLHWDPPRLIITALANIVTTVRASALGTTYVQSPKPDGGDGRKMVRCISRNSASQKLSLPLQPETANALASGSHEIRFGGSWNGRRAIN